MRELRPRATASAGQHVNMSTKRHAVTTSGVSAPCLPSFTMACAHNHGKQAYPEVNLGSNTAKWQKNLTQDRCVSCRVLDANGQSLARPDRED